MDRDYFTRHRIGPHRVTIVAHDVMRFLAYLCARAGHPYSSDHDGSGWCACRARTHPPRREATTHD